MISWRAASRLGKGKELKVCHTSGLKLPQIKLHSVPSQVSHESGLGHPFPDSADVTLEFLHLAACLPARHDVLLMLQHREGE